MKERNIRKVGANSSFLRYNTTLTSQMDFSALTMSRLIEDSKNIDFSHQISVHPYYSEFLKFFASKETIGYSDVIVAAHMVYGWMPTMLRINTVNIEKILPVLNRVKNGGMAGLDDLILLRGMINNSMVGPSKLLHFIAPENYAIWDSRIYRYITDDLNQSRISKAINYLDYLEHLKLLVDRPEYLSVHRHVEEKMGVVYSKLRTAELVMFETDKLNRLRVT